MKQTIIRSVLLFTFSATIFSCEKYLDVKQKSQYSLMNNARDCQVLLDNYALNTNYPNDGEASADNYYLSEDSYNALSEEDRKIYGWASDALRKSSTQQWQTIYKNVNDV